MAMTFILHFHSHIWLSKAYSAKADTTYYRYLSGKCERPALCLANAKSRRIKANPAISTLPFPFYPPSHNQFIASLAIHCVQG